MDWNHETKEKINYWLAGAMMAFGMVLTSVSAFAVPPLGEVHSSIITIFGLAISFAGALIGINAHYNNELTNFKVKAKEYVDDEIERRSHQPHHPHHESNDDIDEQTESPDNP